MVGIAANGSWMLMTAFRISFMLVRSLIELKKARKKVGTIAIVLVKSTRFQRAHWRLRNPSMAN